MNYMGALSNDTNLQSKANREVNQFLDVLSKRSINKLYKIAQLSWKRKSFWKRKHNSSEIILPVFDMYELFEIVLHSNVMIDAKIKFIAYSKQTEIRTIRFIAEKKRYVTHPKAKFRFNPVSMLKAEVIL